MVQVMACRLSSTKPLREPLLTYRNTKLFIHENTFETVACQNGGHFVQGGELNIVIVCTQVIRPIICY